MTSFRLTEIEQLAIQAKLNLAGAGAGDAIFLGFEVLRSSATSCGWARSEYCAATIDIHFSAQVARAAQAVLKQPVRRTSFLMRGLKHDADEQPA